jgi:hypothetical protein
MREKRSVRSTGWGTRVSCRCMVRSLCSTLGTLAHLRHGTTSVREFVVRIEAHEVHDVDGGGGGHTLDQWVPAESPGADVARSRADVAGKKKARTGCPPRKTPATGHMSTTCDSACNARMASSRARTRTRTAWGVGTARWRKAYTLKQKRVMKTTTKSSCVFSEIPAPTSSRTRRRFVVSRA